MRREAKYHATVVAVDWWVNMLMGKVYGTIGPDSESVDLAELVYKKLASNARHEITEDKLENFASILTEIVDKELDKSVRCILSTDYQPEGYLTKSAMDAEISPLAFPLKTIMWINKNKVNVSVGYRCEIQTLYRKGGVTNDGD